MDLWYNYTFKTRKQVLGSIRVVVSEKSWIIWTLTPWGSTWSIFLESVEYLMKTAIKYFLFHIIAIPVHNRAIKGTQNIFIRGSLTEIHFFNCILDPDLALFYQKIVTRPPIFKTP